MVGYQFPPVRDNCPPLVCDYWRQPGRQREQVVLTFDQERHVPFGACYAQKEHAAFRSSWNRIAPRQDVCMDREISLETSISLYKDRWRVEKEIKVTDVGRVEKVDRTDRQTDRGEADKYRLCVDREISHLD